MKIIKFNGGVGNQLFQWAFCKWCSMNGITVSSDIDIYNQKKIHGGFLLPEIVANIGNDFPAIDSNLSMELNKITFLRRVQNKLYNHMGNHYYEDYFNSTQSLLNFLKKRTEICYLEGWWQDTEYVLPNLESLKREISFPALPKDEEDKYIDSHAVSVHVRRGDYILNPTVSDLYGNICTPKYYSSAIKLITDIDADARFFVFSNDIDFCKELFHGYKKVEFVNAVKDEKAYMDIYRMSLCKHHIVANSSFSWWGAALAEQSGITVMPSKWNNVQSKHTLLLPDCFVIDNDGVVVGGGE